MNIQFKLMGVFGDSGERYILIDTDLTIGEVKKIVQKEFKLVPTGRITFLHLGRRYGAEYDDTPFKRIAVDPLKEKITIIVSNPLG